MTPKPLPWTKGEKTAQGWEIKWNVPGNDAPAMVLGYIFDEADIDLIIERIS